MLIISKYGFKNLWLFVLLVLFSTSSCFNRRQKTIVSQYPSDIDEGSAFDEKSQPATEQACLTPIVNLDSKAKEDIKEAFSKVMEGGVYKYGPSSKSKQFGIRDLHVKVKGDECDSFCKDRDTCRIGVSINTRLTSGPDIAPLFVVRYQFSDTCSDGTAVPVKRIFTLGEELLGSIALDFTNARAKCSSGAKGFLCELLHAMSDKGLADRDVKLVSFAKGKVQELIFREPVVYICVGSSIKASQYSKNRSGAVDLATFKVEAIAGVWQ